MFLFSFIILISSFHLAQPFQLYHRVLHPSLPEGPFLKRGSILDTTGNPRILSTSTVLQHGLPLAETSAHVTDALYQLALDPGSKSDSLWLISSIKACHLAHATSEHIVLHLPSPGGTPFALDYFLDPIPLDGTCPPGQVFSPALALPQNATITFSHPGQPPLPQLRVPPPLTATGDPVPLVPDKSYVQKYWLLIVVVLGALLIAPSGEEGPQAS